MKKRRSMRSRKSKKLFTKTAKRVHKKNALGGSTAAMRGGIRL